MTPGATSENPWVPPPDEELSWFRADQKLFATPRPLDYTFEIHALVFGLTYALESNEFPLYALRSRLLQGRVYLAAVPSAMAERDVGQRLKNIHDQTIRFTKNIQRAWERQIKPAVEKHNRWFEEVANFAGSPPELAAQVRKLRRDRGNQWFTMIRGIVAPAALLQANVGELGRRSPALPSASRAKRSSGSRIAGGRSLHWRSRAWASDWLKSTSSTKPTTFSGLSGRKSASFCRPAKIAVLLWRRGRRRPCAQNHWKLRKPSARSCRLMRRECISFQKSWSCLICKR